MMSTSGRCSYSGTGDKADLDNHANQLNPNHSEYRCGTTKYTGTGDKADLNNQMNPNKPRYQGGGGGSKK